MRAIRHIIIHCSASKNGDSRVTLERIDDWHRARGFRKIGYHYVIEVDGLMRAGRGESEIGAHVEGSNADSIGVCMVGTDRFSPAQWQQLDSIVRHLKDAYPAADVKGHRDYSPDKNGDGIVQRWEWLKTCPGFDVADWLAAGMPKAENVYG